MSEMTAERISQLAIDAGLLEPRQVANLFSELGSRDVTVDELVRVAMRQEVLTGWHVERLKEGRRDGFFYGHYKILYLVGHGTFARVYRATHRESGRIVALKVLRQRYVEGRHVEGEAARVSFLQEAKLVMQLHHSSIVPIYEVGEERRRPYMVMEFVEGSNLRKFVDSRKKLGIVDSLRLILDVCNGLEYALTIGVTHRDLKLSNVLVSSNGKAKLVDFGLAVLEQQKSDDPNATSARSIDYAGLERSTGVRRNDPRSDIYFAGCMLYHMISGQAPLFTTDDRAARLSVSRFRDVKPVLHVDPTIPIYVAQLIGKAMELEPTARYQKPGEMAADIRSALQRIERGDAPELINNPSAAEITAARSLEDKLAEEGQSRTVMLIESKAEIQDQLREQLKKRGYRVLVIGNPARALDRFKESNRSPADCVVFSALELGDSAIDAFNQFGSLEETRRLPAILLVDKKQKELIQRAQLARHRCLLQIPPLKVSDLRAMLLKLLDQQATVP